MERLETARVLLDCRWLARGGAGRATELLLHGLAELRPPGVWTLWGPAAVAGLAWDGARHERSEVAPKALAGQRERRVPDHDVAIFMHQIRPLRPGRSVTLVHDTIPLRHGGGAPKRLAKRLFYRAAVALSTRILTCSQYAKATIERDLGVPATKIGLISYPLDTALVERVRALRDLRSRRELVLYVGSFSPHKNLRRLILAFQQTRFREHGGTLLLVGGEDRRIAELESFARSHGARGLSIEGVCDQARLDELYATSRLLVLPSLEEGFGLPAWEALCCGLPVCVSDGGALPEITNGLAEVFPARDVGAMAAAIDRVAEARADVSARVAASAPSMRTFAETFVHAAAASLCGEATPQRIAR